MSLDIDALTDAIVRARCTMMPKNIHVNALELNEFLCSLPIYVSECNPKKRTVMSFMGRPLIPTSDSFILYTGCEYCHSIDWPVNPFDYWICPHCGAPVCAG